MSQSLFITGTDTEIGKTHVSVALMAWCRAQGETVLAMKPISAGCERTDEGLRNEDALALREQDSIEVPYELTNPCAYEPPIAPHIAAAEAGELIDLRAVQKAYVELAFQADRVLVEGVGGWEVPLDAESRVSDLAVKLGLPVVLVVGMRLGCINHALLTAEAIRARGCRLVGWVANHVQPDMLRPEENLQAIVERIDAPLLGVLPHGATRFDELLSPLP